MIIYIYDYICVCVLCSRMLHNIFLYARTHTHIVHKQNREALWCWNVLELREVTGRDMENTSRYQLSRFQDIPRYLLNSNSNLK